MPVAEPKAPVVGRALGACAGRSGGNGEGRRVRVCRARGLVHWEAAS